MKRTVTYARALQVLNKMYKAANEHSTLTMNWSRVHHDSVDTFAHLRHILYLLYGQTLTADRLRELNLSPEYLQRDTGVCRLVASRCSTK